MVLFLEIIAVLFLIVIVLLVALLVLPVRILVRGRGDTDDGYNVGGRVMPFAGLCGIGLHYDGCSTRLELYLGSWRIAGFASGPATDRFQRLAEWSARRRKPAEMKEAPEKKPLSERLRSTLGRGRIMRPLISGAMREIIHMIRFDKCYADIRFGFGDPALTGMLAGIIYTINGVLPPSCTIVPSWDFTHTVAGGEIDIDISILNYRFWGALVRLMPDMIRTRREFAGATS